MTTSMTSERTKIGAESIKVRGRSKSSEPHFYFWIFAAICLAFWVPIRDLIVFSLSHDYGSHILLIAPLSIFLVYLNRHEIFSNLPIRLNPKAIIGSSGLFLLGLIFLLLSKYQLVSEEKLSLEILSVVILWISAFVFCYGRESFVSARFPLLFLLLL